MSVLKRALGDDFAKLHPKIREQYGIAAADNAAFFGEGRMERVWRGAAYMRPFLSVGATRRIMFREPGEDVPFRIWNHAYTDPLGRETLTMNRWFGFPASERRFDEFLIWSERRDRLVIYAGTHMHLAVDIDAQAMDDGSLRVRSGAQRFYEFRLGFPFLMAFTGRANVRQWFEDETGRYQVDLSIENPFWGPIFGYRGWYVGGVRACTPEEIEKDSVPCRVERRE